MSISQAQNVVSSVGAIAFFLFTVAAHADDSFSEASVVRSFVDEYNDRDVQGMLALCADDVLWLSIEGKSINVEVSGSSELGEVMKSHFQSPSVMHSELLSVRVNGPLVVGIEQAEWETENGQKIICSTTVYQVEDGKIRFIWYFPAQDCNSDF